MQLTSGLLAALAAGSAMAHMNLRDPAPLAYKGNPNSKAPNIDYAITNPLAPGEFPCKGNLKLLGTPEGAPTKTYYPGQQASMTVEGGAHHNGGSCQISLSYDKGNTFTVIKSFIGNCPQPGGGTFDFTIPDDAPESDEVVFAWTWVNKTGNREYYMSCAVVSIKSGGGNKRSIDKRAVAFSERPEVFQANLGGEYCTVEGVDTVFPNPGPDCENTASNPGPPVRCGGGSGSGGGGAVFMTVSTGSATPAPTSVPVATSTVGSQPAPTGDASGAQSGACSPEGSWNCVDGTTFQRCAGGEWSAVLPLAAGTHCNPGVSDILSMSRRRRVHLNW